MWKGQRGPMLRKVWLSRTQHAGSSEPAERRSVHVLPGELCDTQEPDPNVKYICSMTCFPECDTHSISLSHSSHITHQTCNLDLPTSQLVFHLHLPHLSQWQLPFFQSQEGKIAIFPDSFTHRSISKSSPLYHQPESNLPTPTISPTNSQSIPLFLYSLLLSSTEELFKESGYAQEATQLAVSLKGICPFTRTLRVLEKLDDSLLTAM